jgi:plasmid stabilization system protein ParE
LDLAAKALDEIRAGFAMLKSSPFTCRKAGQSPFLRELIIPFGRSGYVALFEIEGADDVVINAVRHQLEDDYH